MLPSQLLRRTLHSSKPLATADRSKYLFLRQLSEDGSNWRGGDNETDLMHFVLSGTTKTKQNHPVWNLPVKIEAPK